MRDEQVRRYARHILLPDVGGLGQTALMVATARVELHESEPEAELIAATYLAAGGVGTIVLSGATTAQVADVEVAATTVRDALVELDRRHPGISAKLLDNGAVKPFIRIFVGPDDIGGLAGLETKLSERDEIAIVPAIAGGCDGSRPGRRDA